MNTKSTRPPEKNLHVYSVLVDYWDDEAQDSHEILGYRELLHAQLPDLSQGQRNRLATVDQKVMAIVKANPEMKGWDIEMLRDTVKLIGSETQPFR